jgi:hypothetical protein
MEGLWELVIDTDTEEVLVALRHRVTDTVREALEEEEGQPLEERLLELTRLALTLKLPVLAPTDTVCVMVGERERVGEMEEEVEGEGVAENPGEEDTEILPETLTEEVEDREPEGV